MCSSCSVLGSELVFVNVGFVSEFLELRWCSCLCRCLCSSCLCGCLCRCFVCVGVIVCVCVGSCSVSEIGVLVWCCSGS